MRSAAVQGICAAVFLVAVLVWLGWSMKGGVEKPAVALQDSARQGEPSSELAVLKAEIERLKGIVPDQAHAMKDVGYHYTNLWFAGQKKNWPLAEFFWGETRSHLRWAVRIIPVRKDPQGKEIRLAEILDPVEKTRLEDLGQAIREKDGEKFAAAYKGMIESCYACHLLSGKPYLRLQIPTQPEATILRFDQEP